MTSAGWKELKEIHSDRTRNKPTSLPNDEEGSTVAPPFDIGSIVREHDDADAAESESDVGLHETRFIAECNLPSEMGDFKMRAYTYRENGKSSNKLEPVVVVAGDVSGADDVLVRVHDQCFTSEVFGSRRCDCRQQLEESMKLIKRTYDEKGKGGIIVYLQQEGRGIGLPNKIAAYSLQDKGMDTVDANHHLGFADELREYTVVPDILRDMDIRSIRLLTNNPYKLRKLQEAGVKVSERVPLELASNEHNLAYLRTKKMRMNHALDLKQQRGNVEQAGGKSSSKLTPPPPPLAPKGGYTPASAVSAAEQDDQPTQTAAAAVLYDSVNVDKTTGQLKGYTQDMGRASVVAAVQAISDGKVVLVVDDENRENEGDFIMAAERATAESVGYMIRHSSGVICVSMETPRLELLGLPSMVVNNEDPKQTAYTVSVDAKVGTTTGISASDRATTFRKLADPEATADDFYRPGHVFPLRYKTGGVKVRAGHTEASLDLCKLAGCQPCGVLCEVVHDDGSMQRLPALKEFAAQHGLVLTSIQDLVAYVHEKD
jgi:3,4-dihydroxy-2-butanone 4-phosphate synthase/GTP cyclohydrolase II